ncbi:MAG: orotidine-5'-phosphate decarboxylase [Bacteroidales bacterium]|nr:orotidine-5'-phosphate decarboxylase [Bacteroidales bacterium]
MKLNTIISEIKRKQSFLCVGLDSDWAKIPACIKTTNDPVFEFNKAIVDATSQFSIAYKPNIAFYEAMGIKGWQSLEKTVFYIKEKYPEIFIIADAKRGDIGNTSAQYAKAFFETMPFDAITVAPYMGSDSVSPFLKFDEKFVILLALTSNTGANDFQYFKQNDEYLFEKVLKESQNWAGKEKMMYVVGATRAEMLTQVRKIVPDHFLLVPGVGAQGGSLQEVAKYGLTNDGGLIVNSSRAIIFASAESDFDKKAAGEAKQVQEEMRKLLQEKNIC